MIVRSLRIKNFLPFKGEQYVQLPSGVTFITGVYEGDELKSNRAGKTSIIEAVMYCLYGKSRSKKEVDLIHRDEKEMVVEGQFDFDGTIVNIKRGRTSSNDSTLEISGVVGDKKDLQSQINKLIGMSYDDFITTCFFKQEDIHGFMVLGSADKKELLRRWLGMDYWDKYENEAKRKVDTYRSKIDKLESERITYESQIKVPTNEEKKEDLNKEIIERKKSVEDSKDREAKLLNAVSDLNKKLEDVGKLPKIFKDIDKVKGDIFKVGVTVTEHNSRLPLAISEQARLKELLQVPDQLSQLNKDILGIAKELSEVEKVRGTLLGALGSKQGLLDKLNNFKGDCPIDNGKCPRDMKSASGDVQLQCDVLTKEAGKKGDWIKVRKEECTGLETKASSLRELERERVGLLSKTTPEKINSFIENFTTVLNNHKVTLNSLEEEKKRLLEKGVDTDSINLEIRQKKEVIDKERLFQRMCNDKINNNSKEIGEIDERVRKRKEFTEALDHANKELVDHRKDLVHYQFIASMFGKDGIPSIQTENSFQEIEGDANVVLSELQCGLRVEFSSIRETQQWEESCFVCGLPYATGDKSCKGCGLGYKRKKKKDELSIKVFEGDSEQNFEMDSGGGKTLISTAIRIALSRLLQRKLNSKCECLFLDEVLGSLDKANRNYFSTMITKLLPSLGFKQIFMITHTDIAEGGAKNILVVTKKKENFSTFSTSSV